MRKPDASPRNAGSLTRDPSPKYGLSTHFFMLSYIKAWWNVVNWPTAEELYGAAKA
jgi:hypothetical protein